MNSGALCPPHKEMKVLEDLNNFHNKAAKATEIGILYLIHLCVLCGLAVRCCLGCGPFSVFASTRGLVISHRFYPAIQD
jgi:hypothetical protein